MASVLGVGIDVSKDKVDVAVSDGTWHATFLQTTAGLDQLVSKLTTVDPRRVVLEASGGYEHPNEPSRSLGEALPPQGSARVIGAIAPEFGAVHPSIRALWCDAIQDEAPRPDVREGPVVGDPH